MCLDIFSIPVMYYVTLNNQNRLLTKFRVEERPPRYVTPGLNIES
jgi:hypothetical protein